MKKTQYILTIICIFFIISCDDYLDQPNPNAPEFPETIQDLEDTNLLINAVYNSLFHHYVLSIEENTLNSDEGSVGNRGNGGNNPLDRLVWYRHEYNSATTEVSRKWAALYRGIFIANQAIHGLELIEPTISSQTEIDEWNKQKAEAQFFRGLYHFYLHSTFNNGNIIIRDRFEADLDARNKDVSSSEEVIDFFRQDLKAAIEFLPNPSEIQEQGRITKGTATMILANSYLYEGTDAAIETAKNLYQDLINNFGYQLETDMAKMFTTEGEFNSESIFEVPYTIDFNVTDNAFDENSLHNRLAGRSAPFTFGGQQRFLPSSWLILEYLNEEIDPLDNRNVIQAGNGSTTTRRVSMRASAMVALNNDLDTRVYQSPNVLQAGNLGGGNNNFITSLFKKYTNHDIASSEQATSSGDRNKSGKNVTINRLSEVYLNLAECYIRQNQISDALNAINAVRSRWGLIKLGVGSPSASFDNIVYDQTTLMEHLMFFEKPLELSSEGHAIRIIDLRRWNVAQARFSDLALRQYHPIQYDAPTGLSRGSITSRANGTITLFDPSDPPGNLNIIYNEFEGAATNYSINQGYLPIPEDEVNNNTAN
ncbi:hypothetical protein AWE51_14805 [Aquimarina aggregata]|uniref:Carbohydrate-binding protein SusD n=1 Tax=Aquimarina aggregata TaxID=1642818 RepID=A0A162XZC6_9FLAO|nr:RagB/SusD family nutrient uptake outer membrane protein [Aquimarina aggregata]KZS38848.1 hypothetical protein AWE51_14805 [Aquimarina aggregata]